MTKNKAQEKIFMCKWCKGSLPDGRTDRQTCSDNCRKAYSRWKLKASEHTKKATQSIDALSGFLDVEDTQAVATKRLKLLENRIRDILVRHNSV